MPALIFLVIRVLRASCKSHKRAKNVIPNKWEGDVILNSSLCHCERAEESYEPFSVNSMRDLLNLERF